MTRDEAVEILTKVFVAVAAPCSWTTAVDEYLAVDSQYFNALQACLHADVVAAVNAAKLRQFPRKAHEMTRDEAVEVLGACPHHLERDQCPECRPVYELTLALAAAEAEATRLRDAVRQHRDQRADDRCWLDDVDLYRAAGLEPGGNHVGDKAAMLENCQRFIEQRCEGGGPWRSYAELEAENARLKDELRHARYAPMGDNHHNAKDCPYCNPKEARAAAPQIAQAFHETCERAAPLHGYETHKALAVSWEEVPDEHRNLVIAVVEDLLSRGVIQPGTER